MITLVSVRGMSLVRRALPEDAAEVLRLRQVMIDSTSAVSPVGTSTGWHTESLPTLRERLAEPDGDFAAFVVDHPERPGTLAALVVGTVEYRIGRAATPGGSSVSSSASPPTRTRAAEGTRAGMDALLAWFRARGVVQVHLTASADAAPSTPPWASGPSRTP